MPCCFLGFHPITKHLEEFMIGTMETTILENRPRKTIRSGRVHFRSPNRLSVLFPEGNVEEPKPHFRIAPGLDQDRPRSPMRVLLRNSRTSMYLGTKDRWTKDAKEALDFRNGWWATAYAFTMNPRHLVIHYEFENDRYNLHIPVLGHAHG